MLFILPGDSLFAPCCHSKYYLVKATSPKSTVVFSIYFSFRGFVFYWQDRTPRRSQALKRSPQIKVSYNKRKKAARRPRRKDRNCEF